MRKEIYRVCDACFGIGNWFVVFAGRKTKYKKDQHEVVICYPCIFKAIKKLARKKK